MDESTTDSLGISDAQIAYLQNEVSCGVLLLLLLHLELLASLCLVVCSMTRCNALCVLPTVVPMWAALLCHGRVYAQ